MKCDDPKSCTASDAGSFRATAVPAELTGTSGGKNRPNPLIAKECQATGGGSADAMTMAFLIFEKPDSR
ncbi:MAG TPA: hypothetical protein PLF26_21565, partial [Blastocatellia bacterium]|nr:hypothetical protein [Blastocatellia bacterium]